MDQPKELSDDHVFINLDKFNALPDGTKLIDSSGRVVFKMKECLIHHTEQSVFDPSDGTICHASWFDGLQARYSGKQPFMWIE